MNDDKYPSPGLFFWGPLFGIICWSIIALIVWAIAGGLETGGWSW